MGLGIHFLWYFAKPFRKELFVIPNIAKFLFFFFLLNKNKNFLSTIDTLHLEA